MFMQYTGLPSQYKYPREKATLKRQDHPLAEPELSKPAPHLQGFKTKTLVHQKNELKEENGTHNNQQQ